MKQVWVNAATCCWTASTTAGAALPTLVTAIPEPRSMNELPSTSTSTPPPARSTKTGIIPLTAEETALCRRCIRARERGPGTSVTRRRSCSGNCAPVRTLLTAASSADARESGECRHDLVVNEPQLLVDRRDARQLLAGERLDQRGVGDGRDQVVDPRRLDLLDLRRHLVGRAGEGELLRDLRRGELDAARQVTAADRVDDRLEALGIDPVALQLLGRHGRRVDADHAAGGGLGRGGVPADGDDDPRAEVQRRPVLAGLLRAGLEVLGGVVVGLARVA